MKTEIRNAKVTFTQLCAEDHGVFTAIITVEGDGWGCGFGGYSFDSWNEAQEKRIGTGFGIDFLKAAIDVTGVNSWEDLPGTLVRVKLEGINGGILELGHITKDKWFNPKVLAAEVKGE